MTTETQPTPGLDPGPPGDAPAPRWVVGTLRGGTVVSTALIFVQAALAGGFVTGDVGLLTWHATNSDVITTTLTVVVVGAVGLWWRGRGPGWPIWASLLLTTAAETQKFLGYFRVVDVHIPLGVLVFGGSIALMLWTLGPLRVRPRTRAGAGATRERGGR